MEWRFPRLFSCARDCEAKVADYMIRNGEVDWAPIFRRNLREEEENQFFSLLNVLSEA